MATKKKVTSADGNPLPKTTDPLADFRNFLYLAWEYLGLPEPTPIQYDIAYYLQHGPRRSIIEAFRGVGKSWITVAYVCWRLLRNPQLKIMVVSASGAQADNFATFAFQLIYGMDLLSGIRPKSDQRDSKKQFDVGPATASRDPSVKSVGITGQLTGSRADLIIADDIESANNSLTQTARDRLLESVKEFDAILKPGGEIKYLGTPQTETSIYNELPNRGYEIRIWPARFPDEKLKGRYGHRLAPKVAQDATKDNAGKSTDPRRFSDIDLAEREGSYGRSGFALQFMLDTSLADTERYPLKLADLIVDAVDAETARQKIVWASSPDKAWKDEIPNVGFNGDRYYRPLDYYGDRVPYTGSVMSIDPSGRGSDETGYAVLNMLNGYLHCPALGGLRGGYDEPTLVRLAETAKDNRVNRIIIESNFGDGMFTALFKPVLARIYPVVVEEVRHSKQKELRIIDTLEPLMNRHRLVIDPSVIRKDYESAQVYPPDSRHQYMLFWQLSRITKDRGALKHDDRLDALAIAAAYWVEQMSQDEGQKIEDHNAEAMRKELEKYIQNALGGKPASNSWIPARR